MLPLLIIGAAICITLVLLLRQKTLWFLAFFASTIIFQNILAMLLLRSGVVPIERGQLLLYIKEVVLVTALLTLGSKHLLRGKIPLNLVDSVALGFIVYLLVLFFLPSIVPTQLRVAGLRSLILLPCFYLLGRWLYHDNFKLVQLQHLLVAILILFCCFGLSEFLFLPDNFWLSIGHEEYYLMKEARPIQGSLYLNMFFWDLGTPIRRVASLTGDPLLSSYIMIYGVVLIGSWMASLGKLRWGYLVCLLLLVTTVLTFSRGSALVLLVAVGTLFLSAYRWELFIGYTIFGFVAVIAAVTVAGDLVLSAISGSSHVEGLRSGLEVALRNPFGIGLGTSGNLIINFLLIQQSLSDLGGGGDSFTGSLAVQTGLVGLCLMYGFLCLLSARVYWCGVLCRRAAQPFAWFYFATAGVLAGLLVSSAVNESGYSFTAAGIVFVVAGVLVSAARKYMPLAQAVPVDRPLPSTVLAKGSEL
jgi:hypothetical protein